MESVNKPWGPVCCLRIRILSFWKGWMRSPFSDAAPGVWWRDVPMPGHPAVRTCLTSSCYSVSLRVCCDSRWKSSGCWSSQSTNKTQFSNKPGTILWKKCSCRLHVHSVSTGVLAFCTKDSSVLTMPLFRLCDVKSRRATDWSCGVVSASSCYMSDKVKGYSDTNMGKFCTAMEGKSQQQLGRSGLRAAISVAVVQKRRRNMWGKGKENSLSSVEQGNTEMVSLPVLTHLSVWPIWWPQRWTVQLKRQGQACGRGQEWTWRRRQGWRKRVEGQKKGKWIADGLFLVLTEGSARATRAYCSRGAPSNTDSLRLIALSTRCR